MFDMGLEKYVVASAINGMLVRFGPPHLHPMLRDERRRRLNHCLFAEYGLTVEQTPVAVGCGCHSTGFSGRTGIFELISADDRLKDLVKSEDTTRIQLATVLHQRYQGLERGLASCRGSPP